MINIFKRIFGKKNRQDEIYKVLKEMLHSNPHEQLLCLLYYRLGDRLGVRLYHRLNNRLYDRLDDRLEEVQ